MHCDRIVQSNTGSIMLKYAVRTLRCDRGATAIEYGVIVALILVAMIGALRSAGEASSKAPSDIPPSTMQA
ncbi:MAG: Flp family type IVb pilin [Pseudomonadota bacterium]